MRIFDLYFASVVSLQYHPANPPEKRMSLEDCACVARDMLKVRYAFSCDKAGCTCDWHQE